MSRFKHEDDMTEADMVRTHDQYLEHQRQSGEAESMAIARAEASGIVGAAIALSACAKAERRA